MNKAPLILMYHGIKTDPLSIPEGREIGAFLYDVPLENFKSQMFWLKTNDYQTISIDEINFRNQDKQVILTFDDGEANNFIHAFPILRKLNFKAYFFVIVDRIGKPGYIDWNELYQLYEAGMIIGSHSLTHPILTNLTPHQVEDELYNSLKYLVNYLGSQVDAFSIPRGFCNDQIIQTAYTAGYKQVFISERPDDLTLKCWERIAVKGSWDIQRFEQAIRGEKPINEQIFYQAKKTAKKFLKGASYNQLRKIMLNITQL